MTVLTVQIRPRQGIFVVITAIVLVAGLVSLHAQTKAPDSQGKRGTTNRDTLDPEKEAAFTWIDKNAEAIKQMGLELWNTPELPFREFKTSRALEQYLEANGFKLERSAGGMPTAFVATYGSGKPVIALWTEEDALAGMSQKIEPVRDPVVPGGPGHACAHNLIGPSTVEAAVAVAQFLQRTGTKGTLRVYGTPAEETGSGKEFMLEAGLFKDVDILLGWHPSTVTRTEFEYTKALAELHFHFKGVASHASVSPERGRNALHGVELMDAGVNYLREQLKEDARISYVTSNGGGQPNVIPPEAESWYSIRTDKHDELVEVVQRVTEVAKGAAMMTGTQVEVRMDSDQPEVLPNRPLAEAIYQNQRAAGAPAFTEDEKAFTLKMLEGTRQAPAPQGIVPLPELPTQETYSTDLGNVSWNVPTERFAVATSPYPVAPHTWQLAVSSASSGLRTLPIAAKTLAATAIDCFRSPALRDAARKDFAERTKGHTYTLLTPSDRKPPVYREEVGRPSPGN